MTLAVCRWLLEDPEHTLDHLVHCMQKVGRNHISAGYGGNFVRWLMADHPKRSVILDQVYAGILTRMAAMYLLLGGSEDGISA